MKKYEVDVDKLTRLYTLIDRVNIRVDLALKKIVTILLLNNSVENKDEVLDIKIILCDLKDLIRKIKCLKL